MNTNTWERIANIKQPGDVYISTYRMFTFNGWIVRTSEQSGKNVASSSVFVPDLDHEWRANIV